MAAFLLERTRPWYCVSPDLVTYTENRRGRFRVKNGSVRARAARPFYPQDQTSSACPDMSVWCHEQTWSIAEVAKRKAARRRLLKSDLIILETTGAKTDNDTHVAKKSLCKVSPLAQRPCKFHNTRTGTENCRDVDCRLGRDRTHSSRRLDQQLIRRRQTVAGRRSVLLDISRTCDSRCARRSLLRTLPETINRQQ
jgi:hypothetical protein